MRRQSPKFYLPGDGGMKLQFFHVCDLCRCIEAILDNHPSNIFLMSETGVCIVREWVGSVIARRVRG